ncbi:TolC family protein [Helicobacter sp. T3_23-1059]
MKNGDKIISFVLTRFCNVFVVFVLILPYLANALEQTTSPIPPTNNAQQNLTPTQENQPSTKLDFASAYSMLLEQSDAIKAQDYNLQKAKKLSLGAKLSFLPEINAGIIYAHLDAPIQEKLPINTAHISPTIAQQQPMQHILGLLSQPITFLKQDVVIGAINIIYPLYAGGVRIHGIKLAKIAKQDAKEALRLKKLASFEELASIYYGALLAKEVLEVLNQTTDGARLHYQNALNLEKSGQVAHLEVLIAQVALDKATNKQKEASNASHIAFLALDSALSTPNVAPTSALSLLDKPLKDESYFIEKTLASYPIISSLDLKIDAATQAKKLAFGAFMPQVVAFSNYIFHDNQKSILIQAMPTFSVGVGARISLLSPTARVQKYQVAKLSELEAQSLKSQAIKELTLLTQKTYAQANYLKEEYKSLKSSVELASENLKLQQNAFKQGMATSTQVIDAQNSLQAALIEQKTSAYKAILSLAKLFALSDEVEEFYAYLP